MAYFQGRTVSFTKGIGFWFVFFVNKKSLEIPVCFFFWRKEGEFIKFLHEVYFLVGLKYGGLARDSEQDGFDLGVVIYIW